MSGDLRIKDGAIQLTQPDDGSGALLTVRGKDHDLDHSELMAMGLACLRATEPGRMPGGLNSSSTPLEDYMAAAQAGRDAVLDRIRDHLRRVGERQRGHHLGVASVQRRASPLTVRDLDRMTPPRSRCLAAGLEPGECGRMPDEQIVRRISTASGFTGDADWTNPANQRPDAARLIEAVATEIHFTIEGRASNEPDASLVDVGALTVDAWLAFEVAGGIRRHVSIVEVAGAELSGRVKLVATDVTIGDRVALNLVSFTAPTAPAHWVRVVSGGRVL
jgi:hypothetical protein